MRVMESRGEVEGQRVGTRSRRQHGQRICAEGYGVDGQLLDILHQQRKIVCADERSRFGAAGLGHGHGAQAGIVVVDEHP